MRRWLTYIALFIAVLGIAGCESLHDDMPIAPNDDYIKIHFAPYGITRGTIEDNESESFMSHLDIVIYKVTNQGATYEGVYHERVNVSATPDGVASIKRTKDDFEVGATYKIYVIANSDVAESVYYNGAGKIIDHQKFLKLDQTNRNIHLSGINFGNQDFEYPYMFVMDGVAYIGDNEPATGGAIVVNNGTTDDVTLGVTLRRAAAKIIVTIKPGDKVTFTPELMKQSQGYLLRNMPIRTTLVAEGGYPLTAQEGNYWISPTISQSPYFQLVDDGNGGYNMQITAYCYSHTWESAEVFERGTSLVVMLPMIYQEEEGSKPIEYINNYYQISISKPVNGTSTHLIKRNTLYDLRVNLNAPGADDYTAPEEIKDLQYFTTPWQVMTFPVSGENTVKYLKVNKNKLIMYNTDEVLDELYFSSSSPVEVKYVSDSGHYFDKYSTRKSLSNADISSIKGIVDPAITSGNIGVHSDVPTNNTIRYFQIQVTNEEGLSEIINVEQYPLIYITNGLPWYSYRDDYYYRTSGGHSWNGNVEKGTTSGDSPTTYRYAGDHITSIYKINSVDVNTKTVKYTYSSATPSSSSGGTGWTASKVRGNKVNNSQYYTINYYKYSYSRNRWGTTVGTTSCENHNVRNYHVRVMASSKDYTLGRPALDEYGFTAGDADNAKLVSPSFVIASRLGAVLSTYSGLSGMTNDKKLVVFADHCKNYVEVDDVNDDKKDPAVVYDNWRLPTEAELNIIISLQGGVEENADAIDYLLNGRYYMSASGPVYNPQNTPGKDNYGNYRDPEPAFDNPWDATDVAIRCVRDAYE